VITAMANAVTIQLCQVSATASEAQIGHHRIIVDRPAAKGGSDSGPMGGELFLASIGGCFMSNLLAAIRSREAGISGVQTEVIGTQGEQPARFTAVELTVTADPCDRELLERMVTIAERGCIMVNTLRGAVELKVRIGATV
jgi:putative redox protein